MAADAEPEVKIESTNGLAWGTRVTVDGSMIPCTKVSWIADAQGDFTHCQLELPRVRLDAAVWKVVAKYADPAVAEIPMHWWECPCGASEAHQKPQQAMQAFHNPSRHARGCPHVTETV